MKSRYVAAGRVVWSALAFTMLASTAGASGDGFKDALFSDRTGFLLQVPLPGRAATAPGQATDGLTEKFGRLGSAIAEREDVPASAVAELATMRGAGTGDAAWDAGPNVPQAARLYTAAAVDFIRFHPDEATVRFEAILALPWSLSRPRAAWAAFMLGRIALARGDLAGTQIWFPKVRSLVLQGARDDLGLAAASYGEQARLLLRTGNVPAAVRLYTAQSTHLAQQQQALQSLQCAAEFTLQHAGSLAANIADPQTRSLVLRYAVAASIDDPGFDSRALLDAVLAAPQPGDPADALASLAYANGDYARAAAFAERAPVRFSLWLRAKLAFRDGRAGDAASLFNAAFRSAPDPAASPGSDMRLAMETGVMNVRHGDFVLALHAMWPVAAGSLDQDGYDDDYVYDSLYLADRVLTLQELQTFVDGSVPAGTTERAWAILRDLLARRLARNGRMEEALAYYRDPGTRANAVSYLQAVARAREASGVARAESLWDAATLMRNQGIQMTGTELWPDGVNSGGALEVPDMFGGLPFPSKASEFSEAELQRYNQSKPEPDIRFHYRYIALEHVQAALQSLPARSQAAAAMLCHAASWMRSSHDQRGETVLWQQYVHSGPAVGFARHFGSRCPAPDFTDARNVQQRLLRMEARDFVHAHKRGIGLAGLGAGFAALAWMIGRTHGQAKT
jgi:hypothetical protein